MDGQINKTEINEKGLIPKEIIGATDKNGELEFLITWTNENEIPKLVSSKVAKEICPYLVIEFYEKRLTWKSDLNKYFSETSDDSDADKTDDEINKK